MALNGGRSQHHLLLRLTHDAVGHEVMPVEFASAVIPLVEVFHLGDQVLQLRGQRDENLLAAPRPRSGVQDLNVHTVRYREYKKNWKEFYWSQLGTQT